MDNNINKTKDGTPKLKCIKSREIFDCPHSSNIIKGKFYRISPTNGGGWIVNLDGSNTHIHYTHDEIKCNFATVQEDRENKLKDILN